MKLYVLLGELAREDSFVLGVYSSFEEAQIAHRHYINSNASRAWEFDAYCVVEKTLDETSSVEWKSVFIAR